MFTRPLACLATFLLFALTPFAALAQMAWGLTNISNQTLKFQTYEPARGTWRDQTIYPNQPANYTMEAGTGKFRISTQGRGYVEYQVKAGARYTLGWDNAKGVWDLKFAPGAAPVANAAPQGAAAAAQAAPGGWEIRNGSNETLKFETFDPARGTWKAQQMFPNEAKTFTFSSGSTAGKFRIATQGRGFVEYAVRAGWKYNIVWDSKKGTWDLRTLQRGA